MKASFPYRYKLRPLPLAMGLVLLSAITANAEDASISKSAVISDPLGGNPATAAPGDTITYSINIGNASAAGEFLHGIDIEDALPAGVENYVGGSISGASTVRIYRDDIESGDGFDDDAASSGNDGNSNFSGDWQETSGANGTQENNGASSGDLRIMTTSGREVIRIQDNDNPANDKGEGVYRIADLNSCSAAILSFEIAGKSLDTGGGTTGGDGLYLDVSTNGTSWTDLARFDPDGSTTSESLTDNNRDIVNDTFEAHSVSLPFASLASTTYIRFTTDDDVNNNEGGYIDNVQITAICEAASPAIGSPANLLTSDVYSGANYGLDTGSLTATYSVEVSEGRETDISNDALVRYTDLVGNATTIGGTEQTSTNSSATSTVTLSLRDDFGDAPETQGYTTLLVNDGPRHVVDANIYLGDQPGDADSGGFADGSQASGDASEDDGDNSADEGVAQLLSSGSSFPVLMSSGGSYSLTLDLTNNQVAAANLFGWIDFDGNGDFDEDELASTSVSGSAGTTTASLSWTNIGGVGPDINSGTTYARFRLTTDTSLIAGSNGGEDEASFGFADDGEVEDYQISIVDPICYAAYSDAGINDTVFDLIGLSPTATGTQSNFNVVTNNNDADNENYGMILTTELVVPATGSYTFWLSSDDGSHLYIDDKLVIDNDGLHGVVTETATITLTAGTHSLQTFFFENTGGDSMQLEWDGSGSRADVQGGDIQAPALCPASPGFPLDFGDADAGYSDAYHSIGFDDDYSLGSIAPDTETSQQASAGANGDDSLGSDDEDADPDLSGLDNTYTGSYIVSVPVSNSGADATLGGWIDFDGDGQFETSEYASATVTSSDSSVNLSFDTNAVTLVAGTTYARFRISRDSISSASATGYLAGGEVEDYSLTIVDLSEVYFEAECGIAGNVWTAVYDPSVSQSTYIETTLNRTNTLGTATEPDVNMVRYDLSVPIAGTYDLYALVNFDGSGDNSFHVSTNNLNWITWNSLDTNGAWQWGDTTQNITTSSNGENISVYISYREDGSYIDKFAISNSTPTGLGNDVGSCFDFGDANDSSAGNGANDYSTELARSGAYHAVDGSAARIRLGSVDPDTEPDALDNINATGDDPSDEGAEQLLSSAQGSGFPVLLPTDTSYSFEIDALNAIDSTDASLFAWVDFDMDGLFEESELADGAPFTIGYSASNQTQTITWTGLSGLVEGSTTARFRISTDTGLTAGSNGGEDEASLGVAIDGEVEDHLILIGGDDYGDAPASYGDASHARPANPTLYLGPTAPDLEVGTLLGGDAGAGADGDDSDGSDDESSLTIIPVLSTDLIGSSYSLSVNVVNTTSDATADLFGWIDFDGSGSFDTDEAASVNTPANGIYSLSWTVPGDTVITDSYIRLRLTTDASVTTLTPASLAAADGEVEDYALSITAPLDYGDAIDTALGVASLDYRTELADDGPRHLLSANLFLGDTAADADPDALDNGTANGDDIDAEGDEGLPQLLTTAQGNTLPEYLVSDSSYSFDIDLTNNTGGSANLYAWIDYDHNGSFDEDEIANGGPVVIADGATSVTLNFTTAADASIGNVYMRLRLTTDNLTASGGGEDERSYGPASDGEVEDYRLILTGLDFGDAPDSYGTDRTLSGSEGIGPSHAILGTLYIGSDAPDVESDGIPSLLASGDDTSGIDDEGGYFVAPIGLTDTSYSLNVNLVNNTGIDANLIGWLDFEADGDFTGPGEGVSVSVPSVGATTAVLSWPSFTAIPASQTFLRLRLTTDAGITTSTPGGAAFNGEVEDRIVVVGQLDFGDAPDSYSTDSTAGNSGGGFDGVGPSHALSGNLYIGDAPDGETDGQASAAATGDGSDEDNSFVTTPPLMTPANQEYSLDVVVTNSSGEEAELVGWIDFDLNGFFDTDEAASVTVADSATSATLTWNSIPADITTGDSFLRLRLTSDPRIATGVASTSSPKGVAANGEVEDHSFSISIAYDYGDAPDSYGTDSTNGGEGFGPRHIVSPVLFIGPSAADAEADGQPSADALLDDDTGVGEDTPDDSTDGDEGDLFLTTIQPSDTTYVVNVPLTNATGTDTTLYGWLDINQDGDFSDTNESVSVTVPAGSSFATLAFSWTSGNTSGGNGMDNGETFLRLRLSSDSGLGATQASAGDAASDGEVSDYRVQVSQTTCDLLYGIYDSGGNIRLREFDNDTVNLTTTVFETAGIGIERNYRRTYYVEWVDSAGGGTNQLYYYDPSLSGTQHINTGASLPDDNTEDTNFNRMAFSYDGRGVIVGSDSYDIYLFDPTVSGTGQSVYGAIPMQGVGSIQGGGGDVAFDRDDNLYLLSYDTGGGANFYLYEIRFFQAGQSGTGPEVHIDDITLNGSTSSNYEATATLLITEPNSTGGQIAGMAFNYDNLIYLHGSAGQRFTWDVGITATGGSGAITSLSSASVGSADLASCIYPYIRAILEPIKTVINVTSGGTGYIPGDELQYSIVVRNSGGFPSFDTVFQDDIPAGTTYIPNSTTMNGDAVPDFGGRMPFELGREIHTQGQSDGTVLADITPGLIGDNEVVIKFSVRVDGDTGGSNICNQGYVDFEANLSPSAIPTDNPATGLADDATCRGQTSGFKVSGTLFEDYNVDGVKSAGEPGISGVSILLYNSVSGVCKSVLTDANGFYQFQAVTAGPKTIFERSGSLVPTPSPANCPPSALGIDPSGFLSSSNNSRSIYVVNQDITDVDFGDVRTPIIAPNLEGVVIPGNIQTYSHLFTAPTDGDVSFTVSSTSSPSLSDWTSTLFLDADCSGDLSSGDTILNSALNLTAGESACLLNRVFAPSIATAGNTMLSELSATFNYQGSLVSDQLVIANDRTLVLSSEQSSLRLTKRVQNISQNSTEFDASASISNAAKPGDRLRYEISFANTGDANITDINIYDAIPAFTELAEELDLNCAYTGPAWAPETSFIPSSITSCTLITPSSAGPDDNEPGYRSTLHWQLIGTLRPGQEGTLMFTVDVK